MDVKLLGVGSKLGRIRKIESKERDNTYKNGVGEESQDISEGEWPYF